MAALLQASPTPDRALILQRNRELESSAGTILPVNHFDKAANSDEL